MIKVRCIPPLETIRQLTFLEAKRAHDNRLFQDLPLEDFDDVMELVHETSAADVLLVPHMLSDLHKYPTYLPNAIEIAREAGKKLLLFTTQDDPAPIIFPDHCIIFRPSAYASTLLANERVIPAQVQDLGRIAGHEPLPRSNAPTIGFVGKADTGSFVEHVRYLIKNYVLHRGPNRDGTYFRRTALKLLSRDQRMHVNAIMRSSFSANTKSIKGSPEVMREEYIQNIVSNLFTLSARGAGNYSLRFYETLSLGRIPILIDTDMTLPFEDRISYDRFIIRVPWQKLHQLPDILFKRFSELDDKEVIEMQRSARSAFEEYLYLPAFLKTALAEFEPRK